ncbi:hypothetical protein ACFVSN_22380 [Kitasatospora sp. NPDC057904]|uniref:hypothetical protein n=1 Tax=unclassified Kitasatospora TaxID=2633591 RepID=UPI0036D95731
MTDDADTGTSADTSTGTGTGTGADDGIDESHLAMYSLLGSRLLRVTTARRHAAGGLRLAADAEVS